MATVIDSIGRSFDFDKIRFKWDDELMQQAAKEVLSQNGRERPQLLLDRYCQLHKAKYLRNYEPGHFSNGGLDSMYASLYENINPAIRITIDITQGELFEKFVGMPYEHVEAAVKRDPRAWVLAGNMRVEQK